MKKLIIFMVIILIITTTAFTKGKTEIPEEISSTSQWTNIQNEEFVPTKTDVYIEWTKILEKLSTRHLSPNLIDNEFSYNGKMNFLIRGTSYLTYLHKTQEMVLKFGSVDASYYMIAVKTNPVVFQLTKVEGERKIIIPDNLLDKYMYTLLWFFNQNAKEEMSRYEMLEDMKIKGFI